MIEQCEGPNLFWPMGVCPKCHLEVSNDPNLQKTKMILHVCEMDKNIYIKQATRDNAFHFEMVLKCAVSENVVGMCFWMLCGM